MKTQELLYNLAIFAVIGIIGGIYILIKQKRDLKKAEKGEDMARLKALVGRTLPGETEYQVAYAHWKKSEYKGRRTITTYYCYALAFDTDRLIVIPVTFDKDNDMTAHEPILFTGETLGIAKVAVAKQTDREEIKRVEVILHDKQGKEMIQFYVDAANTREDRFHPVNIHQPEECRRFSRFMETMSRQVSQENTGLEERLAEDRALKKGKLAKTLGIIGIVCCMIMPAVSIILGIIGFFKAPKSKKNGGAPSASFLLPLISLVLGILCGAVQMMLL